MTSLVFVKNKLLVLTPIDKYCHLFSYKKQLCYYQTNSPISYQSILIHHYFILTFLNE